MPSVLPFFCAIIPKFIALSFNFYFFTTLNSYFVSSHSYSLSLSGNSCQSSFCIQTFFLSLLFRPSPDHETCKAKSINFRRALTFVFVITFPRFRTEASLESCQKIKSQIKYFCICTIQTKPRANDGRWWKWKYR